MDWEFDAIFILIYNFIQIRWKIFLQKHFWSNLDGAQWKLFHHGKKCNQQTKNVLHSFNIKAIEKLGVASSKKNALNKSNHDKKNDEEFTVLNHIKYSQA